MANNTPTPPSPGQVWRFEHGGELEIVSVHPRAERIKVRISEEWAQNKADFINRFRIPLGPDRMPRRIEFYHIDVVERWREEGATLVSGGENGE